eukprot:3648772-Rhodomonas_salina.2
MAGADVCGSQGMDGMIGLPALKIEKAMEVRENLPPTYHMLLGACCAIPGTDTPTSMRCAVLIEHATLPGRARLRRALFRVQPVSYTHLTLPTICSV